METNEYQKRAHAFATYGDGITYPSLGLCEEAGEVAGKIAKFIRKNDGRLPNLRRSSIWSLETFFRRTLTS